LVYGFLPKPVSVDAVAPRRGLMKVTVEEEGRTRVKDRFVVSAPVPGYLRRIELEVGDAIKKGQRIAVLEPLRSAALDPRTRAEAEALVASARASLDAARERARAAAADEEYARERNIRMKKLAEGGFISKDDFEQSDSGFKKAEATRLSAEATIAAARSDLARAESTLRYSASERGGGREAVVIRSPSGGTVLKLHRESEGVVNAADPLLDIGDPLSMEIKIEVLSADAVKIKKGTSVIFERWGGEKPLSGRVRVVEPAGFTKISSLGVEEQRVLVIADFTSPTDLWRGLGDSYRLDASFIIWEGQNILQVPASALFRKGDDWELFLVENKRARVHPVVVGHRNGLTAEIVSGLTGSETVIAHPDDTVREGGRVRIR
jgi:HlyD family secretion protein